MREEKKKKERNRIRKRERERERERGASGARPFQLSALKGWTRQTDGRTERRILLRRKCGRFLFLKM